MRGAEIGPLAAVRLAENEGAGGTQALHHERVGRGKTDRAFLRLVHTGEQPEQGGFARTVGSHDADDVARRDVHGEFGEEVAVVVTTGEVLGNKGCSH